MNRPLFSLTAKALYTGALVFCIATASDADTYRLLPDNRGTQSAPVEFSDPANWTNTTAGTMAVTCPQPADTIWIGTYSATHIGYIALDDDYSIADFTYAYNILHLLRSASAASDVTTLTITGNIGGGAYQQYHAYSGTKLVFPQGSSLTGATGDASAAGVDANGGEIDVSGSVRSRHIVWQARNGGKLVVAPSSYGQTGDTASINDKFTIDNSGSSILFPNGLTITGGNSSWANEFNHNNGTVTFGGDFTSVSPWTYTWKAGTLAATANCSFSSTVAFVIPDSRTLTADTASGATLAIPATASIGSGVSLTKTGSGDLLFAGAALPATMSINAGGLALGAAGSYDLSSATFAANTKLKLGASGITLTSLDASIANATFGVADGFAPASGATVLTCADATVLAAARTGLNADLSPIGISVEISGNSLVAESHYTFNSSTVTDLNDVNGWVNQLAAPAGQPAIISGSGTAAVMDNTVPAYSAISVADGASLTIAAERSIPATTLAAGTSLHIAQAGVTMQTVSYEGYIPASDTVIGTMDPSSAITNLTDISGIIGGSSWATDLKNTPYSRVYVSAIDNGAKLQVQFKQWESNSGGSYMKCTVIELWKDAGGDIYAKAVRAAYRQNNPDYDYDFMTGSNHTTANIATSDGTSNYGVKGLSFTAPVLASTTSYALQSYTGTLPLTATIVGTMDPAASITSLRGFAGTMAGSWSGHGIVQKTLAKSMDSGASLLVQFKVVDGSTTKCAIVRFTNAGGTIYAQTVAARYLNGQQDIDHDFVNADGSYNGTQADAAGNDTDPGYGIKDFSFEAPVDTLSVMTTVTAAGDFTTTGSGSVEVDVEEGCVLDLSDVDVTTAATLVKTGLGIIVFGDELPSALSVSAGILAVQPYVEYDMTGVTVGNGVSVYAAIDGTYKPAIAVPQQNGTTVYVTGDTYVGVGGWDTLANWASGALPDASATAHIYGPGTVLTMTAAPAAMPAAISVENGATLRIAADATLPVMSLDKDAALDIVSGTVTLSSALTCIGSANGGTVEIPSLTVQSGATLRVPGDTRFSNVDISLYGTIAQSSDGKLTFGYAAAGQTTYIGLYAEGATVRLGGGSNYDVRRIGICCPEVGGCVVAVRDIVFKDMPTVGTHFPSWSYPDGFHLGYNNPTGETFEVVFDNTKWGVDGNLFVYGGATFRLINGSSFKNSEEYGYWNRHAGVKENGRIFVGAGSELRLNAMGNGGGIPFDVTVNETGHEAVTVEDGGIFETFRWSGNNKGVFASSNGVVRIYNPRYDDAGNNWHYVNVPFDKLSAVALATNSLLTFTTRNGTSSRGFKDGSGPRVVAFADVPITGNGGSITLSNANVNAFGVVVRSASNTATGTAGVSPAEAGMGDTTLYFASGANWAGTVLAGDVSLTNLTDGAAAAAVDFGSLDLTAGKTFPVRVWAHTSPTANDTINVGTYVNDGGELVPVLMDGAAEEKFAGGTRVVVGKIAKTSPLPKVPATWRAIREPIEGDDANDQLTLKPMVGLTILLR